MSLRNRARKLQRQTTLTYQQALQRLEELGARPAALARETGWPLDVCDRYLVDGRAPIAVVEASPARPYAARLDRLCEALRVAANAREVLVLDTRMRALAHVPAAPASPSPTVALVELVGSRQRGLLADQLPMPSGELLRTADDQTLVTAPIGRRAQAVVVFDERETSLGLVRLVVQRFLGELKQALATERLPPPPARSPLTEHEQLSFISKQYGVPSINLEDFEIADEVLALMPLSLARHHELIPVNRAGATLIVAMADPSNIHAIDDLKLHTGDNIEIVAASRFQIREAIERYSGRPWGEPWLPVPRGRR